MSKPSDRRRRKQKARQRDAARQKLRDQARRIYREKYPDFVFQGSAEPGFEKLVKKVTRGIDFQDRSLFSDLDRELFQIIKKQPIEFMDAVAESLGTDSSHVIANMITHIGETFFARMPKRELAAWIPYNSVTFMPAHGELTVILSKLESKSGSHGRIYYSPRKPQLSIDGHKFVVGWSRHAIERTCERIEPDWLTYAGQERVFSFFSDCNHFEPYETPNGNPGFSFFDICTPRCFSELFVHEILGKSEPVDGHYWRVGYCPVVIEWPFARAKSMLVPGYRGTPEHSQLQTKLSGPEKREMLDKIDQYGQSDIQETRDFSVPKWLHENTVPQVVKGEDDWYDFKRFRPDRLDLTITMSDVSAAGNAEKEDSSEMDCI